MNEQHKCRAFFAAVKRYGYLTAYGIVKYLPTPLGDIFRYIVLKIFMKQLKTLWIHEGVTIHSPEKVEISESTAINENVYINGFGSVSIGRKVAIGTGVKLLSAEHGFEGREIAPYFQPIVPKAIKIDDEAYLGMNAVVLGGVTIGKGAVIGAGAVVTKDVPPYAIAVGIPAKVIRYR